jgi:hypothetical protein
MSERKAIYYPNLDEILAKLQQTEYPWMDVGLENKSIIIAWCQDHDVKTIDFQTARAACHNLGPSALESKKPSVAAPPAPPAPTPARAPRFDWHQYIKSGAAIPLKGPDGSTCPNEVLEKCTLQQVKALVRFQEMEKKPWLSGFADQGLRH